jgi:predicted metal-dependent peptidase
MAAATSIAAAITRLKDPDNVASSPRQYAELCDKISSTMTRLFQFPKNGGNPFLFALTGPKPHFLTRMLHGQKIDTAATDGKNFYWNPEFLASMDANQVQTVMSHESYHVLFFHCSPERAAGKDPRKWNIAVDYIVNGVIEHDHEKSGRSAAFKLWGGSIGDPIPLVDYLAWVAGTNKGDLPKHGCFADPTQHGRSPESIYNDIVQAELASPRRCKEHSGGCGALSLDPKTGQSTVPLPWDKDACQKCGALPNSGPGSMDTHLPSGLTKDEVMGEMMRAAEQAAATGRGTAPAEVEAALSELKTPQLRASDIVRQAFMRKAIDTGNKNDWKRLRRRQLAMTPRQYLPRKHDHLPKWVVCLDTSGSMSDQDIANGLKEMQLVPKNSEGWVVPCDAVPYWKDKTLVRNTQDLKRTKITGRGGTVFDQFFAELPKEIGTDLDIVVIISDGDCGHISANLRPACDVLWVITNKREFKPSFGRVVQLNAVRT